MCLLHAEVCNNIHAEYNCDNWAAQGDCVDNSEWMTLNCKKSCHACHVLPLSEGKELARACPAQQLPSAGLTRHTPHKKKDCKEPWEPCSVPQHAFDAFQKQNKRPRG